MDILAAGIVGKMLDPLLWVLIVAVVLIIKRPRDGLIAAVGIGAIAQILAFTITAPARAPDVGFHVAAAALAGAVIYGVLLGARFIYRKNIERDELS